MVATNLKDILNLVNLGPGTFFELSFSVELCDGFFLIYEYFNDRIIMLNYFLEQ